MAPVSATVHPLVSGGVRFAWFVLQSQKYQNGMAETSAYRGSIPSGLFTDGAISYCRDFCYVAILYQLTEFSMFGTMKRSCLLIGGMEYLLCLLRDVKIDFLLC